MSGLADEYGSWLDAAHPANDDREVYEPGVCRAAKPIAVFAGDFYSDYDNAPPHLFAEPLARVQRGHSSAPFCAYVKAPAALVWQHLGSWYFAHWVCLACANKRGTMRGSWVKP